MATTDDQVYDHVATLESLQTAFRTFALLAAHIDDADVERARQTVSTAESIGFVLDPTAYRAALYNGSLERQRGLVELFAKTKKELRRLFPEGWPE